MLDIDDIPADFVVRPIEANDEATDPVTCGTCGLTWDDAIPTSWTPAPSGRCPFEYFHEDEPEPEYTDPGYVDKIIRRLSDSQNHTCPAGRIEAYQRIDLDDETIVQVGICAGCQQVVARRYVVTGPGTGPWTVLLRGK